ncbi:ankyrin repeat-containing [Anaeramoeba flamelloides]|uniref:Ankyrin repeat-containing n=1 Tax=Anaeramoeba flamelloides TaxID=1746091 RepID=A0ABQ8XL86_9EUKA|nr:ankyrin repeat-containing [Anaeramoeba flamelloides]
METQNLPTLVSQGKNETVKQLLAKNSGEIKINEYDQYGLTALHHACQGNLVLVELLVRHGADVNLGKLEDGHLPIHIAVYYEQKEILTFLLKNGADPFLEDSKGWTILTWIAIKDAFDCFPILEENLESEEIKKLVSHRDRSGNTPLHIAALTNATCVVNELTNYLPNKTALNDNGFAPIHNAVLANSKDVLRIFINMSANLDIMTSVGKTSLHYATESENIELVKMLIRSGANTELRDFDSQTAYEIARLKGNKPICSQFLSLKGNSLIHKAAKEKDQKEVVRILKQNSSEAQTIDKFGRTPLHISAEMGDISTIKILLNYGANINALSFNKNTPLFTAIKKDHIDAVKFLVKKGAEININERADVILSALHLAVERDNLQIVKYLLSQGAFINERMRIQGGITALMIAVQRQNREILKELYKKKKYSKQNSRLDINGTDNLGRTALIHSITKRGEVAIPDELLEQGADPNIFDKSGKTALHYAIIDEAHEVVKTLLSQGAAPHLTRKGVPPIHLAVLHNKMLSISKVLLEMTDCHLDDSDDKGDTVYHIAAILGKNNFLAHWNKQKAKTEWRNKEGNTVLHCACQSKGNEAGFKMLLKFGAQPLVTNHKGQTPLHVAASYGNTKLCDILIDAKLKIDNLDTNGDSAIMLAAYNRHFECYELLRKCGSTPFPHQHLRNNEDEKFLDYIINKKFPLEYYEHTGLSCIHLLVLYKKLDLLKKVEKYIENINIPDENNKKTVIQIAAEIGDLETCKYLIRIGAEVVKYSEDQLPHLLAENGNHTECVKIIKDHFKRSFAVYELYETEKNYVNLLENLKEKIMKPIIEEKLIEKSTRRTIFCNIEEIMAVNKNFLTNLGNRLKNWNSQLGMGDIMIQAAPKFKVYIQYSNNYDKSMQTLKRSKRNQAFSSFLKSLSNDESLNRQTLDSILINPIQRIGRYPLLLEAILHKTESNHPDYQKIEEALNLMKQMATNINSAKAKNENIKNINTIQGSLKGGIPVIIPTLDFERTLLKQGDLTIALLLQPAEKYFNELYQKNLDEINNIFSSCLNNNPNNSTLNNNNNNNSNKKDENKTNKNKENKDNKDNEMGNETSTSSIYLSSKIRNSSKNLTEKEIARLFTKKLIESQSPIFEIDKLKGVGQFSKGYNTKKILLFNDCLLITQQKRDNLEVQAVIKLISAFLESTPTDSNNSKQETHRFLLFTECGTFIFSSTNRRDIKNWRSQIEDAIKDAQHIFEDNQYQILHFEYNSLKLRSRQDTKESESESEPEKSFELNGKTMNAYCALCYFLDVFENNQTPIVRESKFFGFYQNEERFKSSIINRLEKLRRTKSRTNEKNRILITRLKAPTQEYMFQI